MLGVYCGGERRGQSEQGHATSPVTLDPVLAQVPGISEDERAGPGTVS